LMMPHDLEGPAIRFFFVYDASLKIKTRLALTTKIWRTMKIDDTANDGPAN
jgi:hypothetical protein